MIGGAVRPRAIAELNSPELIDTDYVTIYILQRADELAGYGVEGVDGAAIGVVRDEQGVAEFSEILGRDGEAPRLIQGRTAGESL